MTPNINRRALLRALPAAFVGGVCSQTLAGSALGASSSGCRYTVEQGSLSEDIVPLSNGETVKEFYPGSFLRRNFTSVVFLWDGPQSISLVVLNDKYTSTIVNFNYSALFEFDGLPIEEGQWVVTDDPGDFNDPETDTSINWRWTSGNRDGGAFRGGLDDGFEITVDTTTPTTSIFGLTDLEFLSGDPADPERIPLELEREFTIKGGCSIEVDISIKSDDDQATINPNRQGLITVSILNTDDFDPSRVDFDSLRFGAPDVVKNGGGAEPAHSGLLEDVDGDGDPDIVPHWEDVDDDGDLDLLVHFPIEDAGFDGDESRARLEGKTKDGIPIYGTSPVTLVGGNSGGGNGGRGGGNGNGNGGGNVGGRGR